MNRNNSKWIVLMSAFVIALGTTTVVSYHAKAEGVQVKAEDVAQERINLDDILAHETSVEGQQLVLDLSQRMGIPAKELAEFFKSEENDKKLLPRMRAAWTMLLENSMPVGKTPSAQEIERANILASTLGSFMKMRRSGLANDLSGTIDEEILLSMQKNYTLSQRTRFAKVIHEASDIAHVSGSAGTMKDAFRKALEKEGYLAKAEQMGCFK